MASIFRVRKNNNNNDGSGGKIVRGRRPAPIRSPYARPTSPSRLRLSSPSDDENPNWVFGFAAPATRMIAGAGKFVSNIFFPDSPTSSSSGDDSDDDDSSSEGIDRSNQDLATAEANKLSQNEVQPRVSQSEAKHVIEQLLLHETFSRDECNKLVKIIQSRTVEFHGMKQGEHSRQSELPNRIIESSVTLPGALQSEGKTRNSPGPYSCIGNCYDSLSPRAASLGGYLPDFRNTAVMEAKKWLEEKKSELYSHLDKSEGTFTSSSSMPPNVTEGEAGSPILMAKSYMKARPPWASPTLNNIGLQTYSPIGAHLFKEDTPYSFGANYISSSKVSKRGSLAVDSCHTLDGTRRVRFKSSEDIVQPFFSEHMDPSSLVLEQKDGQNSAESERQDLADAQNAMEEGCPTPVTHEPLDSHFNLERHNGPPNHSAKIVNSEPAAKLSADIKPAPGSDSNGLPGVEDTHVSSMQGEGGQIRNSSYPHRFSDLKETDAINDTRSPSEDHLTQKEVNKSRDTATANGFPLSSSLSVEASPRPENEGKLSTGIPLEEQSCEVLSEASVEIPKTVDSDSSASGSMNELRQPSKEVSHTKRQMILSHGLKLRSSPRIEKQVAKKIGKFNKKGRGRGK